jgi:hypothetical protein
MLGVLRWQEFCHRHLVEHLGNRPFKSREAFITATARFDSLCSVKLVSEITSELLVTFAVPLRAEGKSEATIQASRAHIMTVMKWAEQVEVIKAGLKPPAFARVPSVTTGRPLSLEEL